MSDSPTFGMWLQQWRKHRDLTQSELAEQVGCAIGTLRNIETNTARPSKQLAARLARALGVTNEDIDAVIAFARNTASTASTTIAMTASIEHTEQAALVAERPIQPMLPTQLTGFIGRSAEVQAISELAQRNTVRLITLTGPGGSGKTRVALQVISTLQHAFADGVVFVDLSVINDPALVLTTIAQALGVTNSGNLPSHQLAQMIANQHMLLLLDNFEQVLDAATDIARLLLACPNLKVMATSRIALDLSGEYDYPIPPLELPDLNQIQSHDLIGQNDAVQLFVERASATNPQFALTNENMLVVAQICHRLDGLPLAIELAAAWIKLFDTQALLERLEHRLMLLSGGRGRPIRQQTMRTTIDWSYQLLQPRQQLLFQQLGVFIGGATLTAIEAICDNTGDVIDGVLALVNQSLLRSLPIAPNQEPRFGMLETIREYALERLIENGKLAELQQRHAQYFCELAINNNNLWDTPTADIAIAQLDQDYDNVRSVLQWSLTHDPLLGQNLAATITRFWRSRGYISEGRSWLAQLLALTTSDEPVMLKARQAATHAAGWLASDQHDYSQAVRLFGQSMALRSALGEAISDTNLLATAALQARSIGNYAQATALLEQAQRQFHQLGDRGSLSGGGMGFALYFLALMYREQGHFDRSSTLLRECITLHQEIGDREGMAQSILGLADLARDQGDSAATRQRCEECRTIYLEFGVQWALGFVLNNLAQAALCDGDLATASTFVQESLTLFQTLQADASRGEVLLTAGAIALAQADYAAAINIVIESLTITRVVGPHLMLVTALELLARAQLGQQQPATAVRLLAIATTQRAIMGTPVRPVDQHVQNQTLAHAQQMLTLTQFEEIWSEATATPLEQILDAL